MRRLILALFFATTALCLPAQKLSTSPCPDGNGGGRRVFSWFGGAQSHVCELRSGTLPFVGSVRVKGWNGGVEILGEDRRDIALEVRVEASAGSDSEARSLLREISIQTSGLITATGPHDRNWSVSYRLRVPHRLAASVEASNGAVSLSALEGDIEATTSNGALHLRDLAGNVRATTTNGGADVFLSGTTWHGSGLKVESTNGAILVHGAPQYAADFETVTTNGGVSGFPPDHRGPTLRFVTTNGVVRYTTQPATRPLE